MSLLDSLNLAVSGVSSQTNQLGIIGSNIANSATTGYKAGTANFQTVMADTGSIAYQPDSVQSTVRYLIGGQGTIAASSTSTNLAITGNGFFVVRGSDGASHLTRAGAFTTDSTGNLVNTAGYTLMGYNLATGALQPVNVASAAADVTVSDNGVLSIKGSDGSPSPLYSIPLATVRSPNNLTSTDGNIFDTNANSGPMTTGSAAAGGFGTIASSSLEGSTADIATDLTTMIATQRNYEANSKVLTATSDMMTKLMSAKS